MDAVIRGDAPGRPCANDDPGGMNEVAQGMSARYQRRLANRCQERRRPIERRHPLEAWTEVIAVVHIRADEAGKVVSPGKGSRLQIGPGQQVLSIVHFHDIDQIDDLVDFVAQGAAEHHIERMWHRHEPALLANSLGGHPGWQIPGDVLVQKDTDQVTFARGDLLPHDDFQPLRRCGSGPVTTSAVAIPSSTPG